MGVWGAKNFDNDTAFCFANSEVAKPMIARLGRVLDDPSQADPGNNESFKIIAAAEILAVLLEQLPLAAPDKEMVEGCGDAYLGAWDEGIEKLATKPGYKEERRAAIADAFERLLRVSK